MSEKFPKRWIVNVMSDMEFCTKPIGVTHTPFREKPQTPIIFPNLIFTQWTKSAGMPQEHINKPS